MVEDLSRSDRLRELAAELADRVGLDEDRKQALDIAASILGVGRLPLSDVLDKKGRLTPEEIARFRDIPKIWADFTGQIEFLKEIGVPEIVEAHCESWDGSGYPKGLAGEEIPLGARLLAVCYRYNGMISDRPDRKAMPHDQAAAEIRRMSGKALDPALVESFIAMPRRVALAGGPDATRPRRVASAGGPDATRVEEERGAVVKAIEGAGSKKRSGPGKKAKKRPKRKKRKKR